MQSPCGSVAHSVGLSLYALLESLYFTEGPGCSDVPLWTSLLVDLACFMLLEDSDFPDG